MKAVRLSDNEYNLYLRREDTERLSVLFPALIRDFDQIDFLSPPGFLEKELLIRLEHLLQESAGTETANGARCLSIDDSELRGLYCMFNGLESHQTSNINLEDYGLDYYEVIKMGAPLGDAMSERQRLAEIKLAKKRQ